MFSCRKQQGFRHSELKFPVQLHIICSLGSNKHFFWFGKIQYFAELYDYIMTVCFPKRRKKKHHVPYVGCSSGCPTRFHSPPDTISKFGQRCCLPMTRHPKVSCISFSFFLFLQVPIFGFQPCTFTNDCIYLRTIVLPYISRTIGILQILLPFRPVIAYSDKRRAFVRIEIKPMIGIVYITWLIKLCTQFSVT